MNRSAPSGLRSLIVPEGTLDSSRDNVIYIPAKLQNLTTPLCVKRVSNNFLTTRMLPQWNDQFSGCGPRSDFFQATERSCLPTPGGSPSQRPPSPRPPSPPRPPTPGSPSRHESRSSQSSRSSRSSRSSLSAGPDSDFQKLTERSCSAVGPSGYVLPCDFNTELESEEFSYSMNVLQPGNDLHATCGMCDFDRGKRQILYMNSSGTEMRMPLQYTDARFNRTPIRTWKVEVAAPMGVEADVLANIVRVDNFPDPNEDPLEADVDYEDFASKRAISSSPSMRVGFEAPAIVIRHASPYKKHKQELEMMNVRNVRQAFPQGLPQEERKPPKPPKPPSAINQTFAGKRPLDSTFAKRPLNSTFAKRPLNSTFAKKPLNATFAKRPPLINATFAKPPLNATFAKRPPLINATFAKSPTTCGTNMVRGVNLSGIAELDEDESEQEQGCPGACDLVDNEDDDDGGFSEPVNYGAEQTFMPAQGSVCGSEASLYDEARAVSPLGRGKGGWGGGCGSPQGRGTGGFTEPVNYGAEQSYMPAEGTFCGSGGSSLYDEARAVSPLGRGKGGWGGGCGSGGFSEEQRAEQTFTPAQGSVCGSEASLYDEARAVSPLGRGKGGFPEEQPVSCGAEQSYMPAEETFCGSGGSSLYDEARAVSPLGRGKGGWGGCGS